MLIVKICLILLLFGIGIQDAKERKVYAFLFPLVGLMTAWIHWKTLGGYAMGIYSLTNLVLLITLLMGLLLIARLRGQKLINHSMGSGDVAMLAVLTVAFPPLTYIALWLCAALFSLILHVIFYRNSTIPFAGNLAILTALALGFDLFIFPSILYFQY